MPRRISLAARPPPQRGPLVKSAPPQNAKQEVASGTVVIQRPKTPTTAAVPAVKQSANIVSAPKRPQPAAKVPPQTQPQPQRPPSTRRSISAEPGQRVSPLPAPPSKPADHNATTVIASPAMGLSRPSLSPQKNRVQPASVVSSAASTVTIESPVAAQPKPSPLPSDTMIISPKISTVSQSVSQSSTIVVSKPVTPVSVPPNRTRAQSQQPRSVAPKVTVTSTRKSIDDSAVSKGPAMSETYVATPPPSITRTVIPTRSVVTVCAVFFSLKHTSGRRPRSRRLPKPLQLQSARTSKMPCLSSSRCEKSKRGF